MCVVDAGWGLHRSDEIAGYAKHDGHVFYDLRGKRDCPVALAGQSRIVDIFAGFIRRTRRHLGAALPGA